MPNASQHRASRDGFRPIRVSIEFFPPKTEEMEKILWSSIERLAPLQPKFVSVTYGAGGSTREEIDAVVQSYWDAGVRHIVALRGDPQAGIGTAYRPHPGGYAQTADLVAGIKRIGDFKVSVSAYPEKHPEASSLDADIDALKAKVDAGADQAITQFFFENDIYLRYVDKVRAAGIDIPIIPGILPVQNFKQAANFARRTGASVPYWLAARFEGLDNDVETRRLVAAAVAAEQVLDLVDHGVNDFHFYSMNRSDLVYAICHVLGLRAQAPKVAAAKAA